jgi:hypothetical protein
MTDPRFDPAASFSDGDKSALSEESPPSEESDRTYLASLAYVAAKGWKPPTLDPAAMYGPAGSWAEATQPFTEASPVGVLVSTLMGFGAAIGRGPFMQVGATPHHAHDFVALVGPTAIGRKGDAMNMGLRPIRLADPAWSLRVVRGFGSGEAVVGFAVRRGVGSSPWPDRIESLVSSPPISPPPGVCSRTVPTFRRLGYADERT